MKIAFMLLHDFRFAEWSLDVFLKRNHFSKEYSRRLAERGHEVTLYMLHQDVASIRTLDRDGYKIKVFPIQFDFPPISRFGYSHNLQVIKELSKDKPDIIHFNNYYLWSFPYVARWAKRNGVKIVCQYHGECDILKPVRKIFIPIYQGVDKYLVAKDTEITYMTESLGIRSSNILKFPNVGVDVTLFKASACKSANPSLLYVGRMPSKTKNLKEKSPWLLLDIVAELADFIPNVEFYLIGDGPGIEVLKGAAAEKGLEGNVTFSGYIENSRLPPLYSRGWATFIPLLLDSIDPFWDGSLKESLACSTPVIGFKDGIGRYSDSLEKIGYLIPPNPKKGAAVLRDILCDQKCLSDTGKNGRQAMADCCSWESVIGRLESIYNSLLTAEKI